jgi:hypothetical protein
MDETRFDAWTRRRFGLAAGGLLAATLGLGFQGTSAKKKHCGKHETKCGKKCVKGTCCPDKPCGAGCACTRSLSGTFACIAEVPVACQTTCAKDADCGKHGHCITLHCLDETFHACFPLCGAS